MILSKRLLILFIFCALNATHLYAMAPLKEVSPKQLNEEMKAFRNRIRLYTKCSRGHCSPEERTAIQAHLKKDIPLLIGMVGAVAVGSIALKSGVSYIRMKKAHQEAFAQYKPDTQKVYADAQENYEVKLLEERQKQLKEFPYGANPNSKVYKEANEKLRLVEKKISRIQQDKLQQSK